MNNTKKLHDIFYRKFDDIFFTYSGKVFEEKWNSIINDLGLSFVEDLTVPMFCGKKVFVNDPCREKFFLSGVRCNYPRYITMTKEMAIKILMLGDLP